MRKIGNGIFRAFVLSEVGADGNIYPDNLIMIKIILKSNMCYTLGHYRYNLIGKAICNL